MTFMHVTTAAYSSWTEVQVHVLPAIKAGLAITCMEYTEASKAVCHNIQQRLNSNSLVFQVAQIIRNLSGW